MSNVRKVLVDKLGRMRERQIARRASRVNERVRDDVMERDRHSQLSVRRRLKRTQTIQGPGSDDTPSTRGRRRKDKGRTFSAEPKYTINDNEESLTPYRMISTARIKTRTTAKRRVSVTHKIDDYGMELSDSQKHAYKTFLNEMFGLGVNGILQQYNTYLKTYVPSGITHIAFDKNMGRNRYKDVICVDKTRVILRTSQDYIHANYVAGPPLLNTFICTQGPLRVTTGDFWEMAMQENAAYIFMLCSTVEANKKKCFQYWPSREGSTLEFGGVRIKNVHVDSAKDPNFVTSSLSVTRNSETIKLLHVLWKNWPDKGVPKNDLAPFRLLKLSREETKRPTIVHCSAGIGRTGTIVAIEMGLQQMLAARPFDIVNTIQQLRIQTEQQFVYIVKCLVSYAWTCGVLSAQPDLIRKSEKFENEYYKMLAEDESKQDVKKSRDFKKIVPKFENINEKLDALKRMLEKRSTESSKQTFEASKYSAESSKQSFEASKGSAESCSGSDDKMSSSSPDFVEKPTKILSVVLANSADENAKKCSSHDIFFRSEMGKVESQRKTKLKVTTSDEQQTTKSSMETTRNANTTSQYASPM
ncbi:Receptor-type tyrosine-protein phosphatase S [Toxocara canis]|uniref:Receptor-type tyrosine-protein phosphatase S n=1 Tax=Toxocara canis TaxID=6265 RepID=A0A0B2V2K9_TOXCA|nr:Receptor-type tyrosine-protein phosphatase S [Toxocara canis]